MHPNYQPQPQDDGKRFLNMSAGVLAIVIAAVIIVCCIGPFALCMMGGVVGAVNPTPTA